MTKTGVFSGKKDIEKEIVLDAHQKEEKGKLILDPMGGITSPYMDYMASAGEGISLVGTSVGLLGPIPRGFNSISAS